MAQRDYYDILGVQRGADADEIKRAYRKLAMKWHPDRNKDDKDAEQRFKEINEAYHVLANPDTRQKYDKYGEHWKQAEAYEAAGIDPNAGARWSSGPGGGYGVWVDEEDGSFGGFEDFSSIFGEMFGGRSPFGGATRGARRAPRQQRGQDVGGDLYLSLREALHGCTRSIQLQQSAACGACSGSGHTGGQVCRSCAGNGETLTRRQIDVKIPPGVRDGSTIRLSGQGAPGVGGGQRGDVLIAIHLQPHPIFRVIGDNVEVDLPVAPWELTLGGAVDVPTLDGTVSVKIPPKSHNGRVIRLRGLGWPRKGGGKGNMLVRLIAAVPSPKNDEQRAAYERLREAFPGSVRDEWQQRARL